jgi:mono/diheme cytochrome c family protein
MVAFPILALLIGSAPAETLSLETPQTAAVPVVDKKTTLDGIYTAAQAARGNASYAMHCSSCHSDDLSGISGPPLKGSQFIDNWREDSLGVLHTLIKETMPRGADKLTPDAYIDILAYMLQVNEYPAGSSELTADTAGIIEFVGRNGPAPVPEFALIQVVGCLTQRSDGVWLLTKATDPVRTRNQGKSTQDELKASGVQPFGSQTFRLVYPDFAPGFSVDAHKGHKMEGKGYFLINPVDQRLSVTWLERVADGCDQ